MSGGGHRATAWALSLVVAVVPCLVAASASAPRSTKREPGSLLVQLFVHNSPERAAGVDVFVMEPWGPTRRARSDADGRAFFPSLPRGWYVVCAPGGESDTVGTAVAPRETTRVVLLTHTRIPQIFR